MLLAEQARDAAALIRDRRRTAFHWVLLPEALSLAESEDGLRDNLRRVAESDNQDIAKHHCPLY